MLGGDLAARSHRVEQLMAPGGLERLRVRHADLKDFESGLYTGLYTGQNTGLYTDARAFTRAFTRAY